MASRTSASVGMMASLAIFAVLCLVLFVFTVIFLAKTQRLTNDLEAAQSNYRLALNPPTDRWDELRRQAGSNQGVVNYLDNALQSVMFNVTGSRRDTLESLKSEMEQRFGENPPPLMRIVESRGKEIETLKEQLAASERDRAAALADLQATNDRLRRIEEEHRDTVAALNSELDTLKADLDRYRESVDTTRGSMEQRVEDIRGQMSATIAELETRSNGLQDENAILKQQLARLRGERPPTPSGAPEESLKDGQVVALNPGQRQVYIDKGRNERVVMGMTFEVYSQGTNILPDAEGNYPEGKATIEVIRIDETSSLCRILREVRGNPIIAGDTIVNPVYDPRKVYRFVVFGNFDTNGDGVATPQEASDIKALIDSWGGEVSDELAGNTDFVVLGDRPILPVQPKPDDPMALIQRYLRMKQDVQRYDDLFDAATRASVPVLNQSRLFTLTGLHAAPR